MAFAHVEKTLEHTDPLPTDRGVLEGRWNQHAAQLQSIAKDMDWLNECIDMRTIVLQRLIRDANDEMEKSAEPEAKVEPTGTGNEKGKETVNEKGYSIKSNGNGAKITMGMKRKTSGGSRKGEGGMTSMAVKEMELRIMAYMKLKKSLAKSVMWQLDEMWRVERAMGKKPGSWSKAVSEEAEDDGYVVADRKWSKET